MPRLGFRLFLGRRLEETQPWGLGVAERVDDIGLGSLAADSLNQLDDLAFLKEAAGQFGVGVLVVALGAHGHQVGDLVLTPCGLVHAGPLAGLLGADLEPAAVETHDRQPRGKFPLRPRLPLLIRLDPLVPSRLQFGPDPLDDSPQLPTADVNLGQIGERLGGRGEGAIAASGRTVLPRIAGEKLCESSRKLGAEGKKSRRQAGQ